MRTLLLIPLVTALFSLTSASAADPPVRVLILSGQNNHDWKTTTPKLKAILEGSGRFAVDVTDHPQQADAGTFARYHLLLSNWNSWGNVQVKDWPAATREAFLAFVRDGGGLVIIHAGGSSFYDWPEYHRLVVSWGKTTGHGPIHSFSVRLADADHPITRGLAPFQITDELWHNPATPPDAKIIATALSATDKGGSGRDEPVALVHDYGKGRCFNLVLGHHVRAMESEGFQALLLRGAQWAATGQVR
jgi:uncharacterized protein